MIRKTTVLTRAFLLLVVGLLAASCRSDELPADSVARAESRTVYSRVGMHAEFGRDGWSMDSTNYVGLSRYFPPGTRFSLTGHSSRRIDLQAEDGRHFRVDYVEKHNRMPADAWIERQFSEQPVDWERGLSDSDREIVHGGNYKEGMSREALFLSVGYPPASLSADLAAPVLFYQIKRFNKVAIHFDASDRIERIQD